MTTIIKEHFVRSVESRSLSHFKKTGGAQITKLFKNWKRAVEKIREHSKSDSRIKHCEAELLAARAWKEGSCIIQQLQIIGEQERIKNRSGIRALLLCTHFLARQDIPHTTNFDKLVDLVVSCDGEDLKQLADRAGRNATYTSTDAVFDFIEAIGTWIDEFQLKLLHKAPFFSLMADECTDITTIEELSVFCRWVEGERVEHFFEILPLKKADAQSIYSPLINWLKQRNIQISKLAGTGFDGTATFSGKKKEFRQERKRTHHMLSLCTVTCFN